MELPDLILKAASFAARAHDGQYRKDGVTPYAAHPFRVCLVVRHVFGFDDPRMLITALLHDTIEDTTTDFDEVEEQFGTEIAQWVSLLSKDKRLAEDVREREYIERLHKLPWQVHVCKLADIYDNLMDAGNMPAEKRERSLKRAEQYLAALRDCIGPETRKAFDIVQSLGERPA